MASVKHIMSKGYTVEKHTQILIALMKYHGIKKVVASPGATNVCLVGSLQNDPYFEIYSSVDERSAAYIACGLARESGEAVALSCTGATASRNYAPGLTEAYYSNLPILAITSTQYEGRVGHLMPQVLDRSVQMNDIVKKSVHIREIHTDEDWWSTEVKINDALLELYRNGGGPVHINLETTYSLDFSVDKLPKVRGINRYELNSNLPNIDGKKIIINVGSHVRWSEKLTRLVDEFCEKYNSVVVCEHISNYRGKYGIYPSLLVNQEGYMSNLLEADIMIHLGTVLGFGAGGSIIAKEIWRVHPDGEIRDTFKKLTKVFEMNECDFFFHYCDISENSKNVSYFNDFELECKNLEEKIPELPFSNPWLASYTVDKLPDKCELHLGILNSLRSWSLFYIDPKKNIEIYSNTGGFGIDGMVSTLLGSAIANPDKLFICIVGDLAFFYDMNAMGNRHMPSNIRLMIVNNGRGTEFRNFNHPAARFGEEADKYMAAYGHYGKQSKLLIKNYIENLGGEYLSAQNKEEYCNIIEEFLKLENDKPIVAEVFTDSKDESDALEQLYHIYVSKKTIAKKAVKRIIGENGIKTIKKLVK